MTVIFWHLGIWMKRMIWRNFQEQPGPPSEFLWISNHTLCRFYTSYIYPIWRFEQILTSIYEQAESQKEHLFVDLLNCFTSHCLFSLMLNNFFFWLKQFSRYWLYFGRENIAQCPASHYTGLLIPLFNCQWQLCLTYVKMTKSILEDAGLRTVKCSTF